MLKEFEPRIILGAFAHGFGSNLIALVCQTLVFIISGRLLGLDGYGAVVSVASLSLILGPWSGLGFDFVALESVARNDSDSIRAFQRGKKLITLTAVPMILFIAITLQVFDIDRSLTLLICSVLTADLYFLRKTDLCIRIYQGLQNFRLMNMARLSTYVARLMGFSIIFFTHDAISPSIWGIIYLVSSIVSSQLALSLFPTNKISDSHSRETDMYVSQGILFAGGITSNRLYSEFDKILLLNITGASSAGMHGVACRIINIVVLPMTSLTNVILPTLYRLRTQEGTQDNRASVNRILRVGFLPMIYGILVGLLIFAWGGSVIVWLLGEEYRSITSGIIAISILPAISACRSFFEEALAVIDQLNLRARIQWLIAAFAITSNLYVIQEYGWIGALWVMLTSEVLLCSMYLLVLLRKRSNANSMPHSL